MAMLRRGDYKFNYYLREEPELYDLQNDPGEFRDLARDPEYRTMRDDLERRLLERWNPHEIESRILQSQADRRLLKPYLYRYLYQ